MGYRPGTSVYDLYAELGALDGVQDFDVSYWQSRDFEYEVYGYKFDAFRKGGYNDKFTVATNPNTDGYTGRTFLNVELQGEADSTRPLKDTLIPISISWDLYQRGFPVAPKGYTPTPRTRDEVKREIRGGTAGDRATRRDIYVGG